LERCVRIGTRKSRLAIIQTNIIIEKLRKLEPGLSFELVPISTTGDENLDKPLIQFGGKGVFVDAFEEALLSGRIDLAVHSAKDMTTQLPEGLGIIGVPEREDPRDVLVCTGREPALGKLAVIGTSSLRRQLQIKQYYDAECRSLRGNVPTRLEKLRAGEYDGILLAAAGLKRLGLMEEEGLCYRIFEAEEFIPAPGQGILAVEGRQDDDLTGLVEGINDRAAQISLKTERRILELLNTGCQEAIGVYSHVDRENIIIHAIYQKGDKLYRVREQAPVCDYRQAAERTAQRLME
jgi:hydroxymethylbilane synthase